MKEGRRERDVVIQITYREDAGKISFTTDYAGNWAPFALIMFDVILSVWEEAVPTMSGMGAKTSSEKWLHAGPKGNDRMWRIGFEPSDSGGTKFFIRISSKDLEERAQFRNFFNGGGEKSRYIRISVSPNNTYQWSPLTPEEHWEAKKATIHIRNEERNDVHKKKFAEDEERKGGK